MTGSARVIGLDVEGAKTKFGPASSAVFQSPQLLPRPGGQELAEQHDGAKGLEPVGAEVDDGEGRRHRVGVPLFDLEVELRAKVGQETGWHFGRRCDREEGGCRYFSQDPLPLCERSEMKG